MPGDRAMKDALDAQDGLYTLVVKHADGTYEPRVIGSIVDYLFAPDDPEAVIEKHGRRDDADRLADGHRGRLRHDAGEFDAESIRTTGRSAHHRGAARAAASAASRPFTVMSCDNLAGQRAPHAQRRASRPRARCATPSSATGSSARCRFPNSMVDRITPQTTDDDRARCASASASRTPGPWSASRSRSGCSRTPSPPGRPPYEDAGVQVVDDVEPYELMKLRLLNASHQALCYFAYLDGYRLVHEAAQDPLYRTLPARLHGRGGHADARAGPGRRPRRLQGDADRALLQPRGPRHGRAPVRGDLGPHPEVAAARRPPQPRATAARSRAAPRSSPAGRATPRAPTSRASRSRSSTGSRTGSARRRAHRHVPRRPRGVRRPRRATSASPRPIDEALTHCTSTAPARRSSATRACSRRRRRAPSRS